MKVDSRVDATVVARGRSARYVVCLFNQQNVDIEPRKFSCHGAADDTAADNKHVGFLPVECVVSERRFFLLFTKSFEFDIVEYAKRAFAYGGFSAPIDICPIVEFSREPDAASVVFDFDGRSDFIDRPAYLCQIHFPTPLYRFFRF